jgi:hypothetical protein
LLDERDGKQSGDDEEAENTKNDGLEAIHRS